MKKYLGMLGLMAVAVMWGGGFVMSDIALRTLTPFQILTGRFLVAMVLMLPMVWRHLKGISREEIKAGVILGLFLVAAFALQTIGLQYTTASKNAFLTATNVVLVPMIAFGMYRKKVGIQGVIGACTALAGAGVLSLNADFSIGFGDALTLACAVCFAFQIFLTGDYVSKMRVMVLNFFQMATAFICSLTVILIDGEIGRVHISLEGIYSVLYLGAVSTGLCFLLQTVSQRYVDETKSAIILSMEAVFGMIFSVLILQEKVTVRMIIGSTLILGAILISEVKFVKTDGV